MLAAHPDETMATSGPAKMRCIGSVLFSDAIVVAHKTLGHRVCERPGPGLRA